MKKSKTKKVKPGLFYLEKACKIAGGPSNLGKLIGCSKQFMNGMLRGLTPIPLKRALLIEKALEHKVTAQQLRPDMADIL